MISVKEAKKILSENAERGKVETRQLGESLGLTLAEDLYSPMDVPSFDNSAMDGYAMKFSEGMEEWEVVQTIQAGDSSSYTISENKAARIFTGAKMPSGTNTVIPQELIERDENSTKIFYSDTKIETGSNVRLKGTQCKKGDLILKKNTPVTPGSIGLLASVGVEKIKVYSTPKVGCIVTGDELKEIGEILEEGEIYNSNGPMLKACLRQIGIKEISTGKIIDDQIELQEIISRALNLQDILILSGGISVGDYDFVKETLENIGVKELFYKIKQRPGKPLFVGKKGKKWIFALPGNPASVLSCFYQYVKPCLEFWMGKNDVFEPDVVLPLSKEVTKKSGFTFFMKGKRDAEKVDILTGQQSFNLLAFGTANCLVELEEEKETISTGTPVKIYDL